MIYFIVFMLLLASVYAFDYRRCNKFYYFSYWAFFIILVLIAGLRYRIGTDSIVYEKVYSSMPKLWELTSFDFDSTRFEPGYIIFSSIPRSISPDFTLMQFFQAFIVNIVVFWFILKNTSNRFLCLTFYALVLYLNLTTQVMREALAVSAFLLAWPAFKNKKWIIYYIWCLIAIFLHTSAIILFILPLLTLPGINFLFRFGKQTIFICVILLILGYLIYSRFYKFIEMLAISDRLTDRAQEYASQEMGGGILNFFGAVEVILKNIVYPWAALFFTKNYVKRERNEVDKKTFSNMQIMVLMGIYTSILSIPMFILGRYFNYFSMFEFALISSCFFHKLDFKRRSYRLKPYYWVILLLPYLALNFKIYLAPAAGGNARYYMLYEPYVSRLDPYMVPTREIIYRYNGAR